ncbi:MAG: reverse transcriptase family protein [Pseudomonadota bacterium]
MKITHESLNMINIDSNLVLRHLKKLAPKVSYGIDNVPLFMFAKLATALAEPITKLYTLSLTSGRLANEWKVAKFTPVHKKGNKDNVMNYRPISLLCSCSKVLESIICEELDRYLSENSLISKDQFGFMKGRSTVAQLLQTFNKWTESIDSGENIDAIYIDLAKAFDSVTHSKLIEICESYGICGQLLAWLTNYLRNRSQFVSIGSGIYSSGNVDSGIPQGSSLGPKLFLLYIDDLSTVCQSVHVKLYADDAKIYLIYQNPFTKAELHIALDTLVSWSVRKQLKIAFDKCYALYLGKSNTRTQYSLDQTVVSACSTIKDLGVIISDDLKFSTHIAETAKTGFLKVNLLFNSFYSKNPQFLVKMYKTFIRSRLEYASEVYSPQFLKDIDLLERVQRYFTRRIPGQQSRAYADRLATLCLKSLEERRMQRDLIMVYKICYGLIDLDFNDFFELSPSTVTRGHRLKLNITRCKLNIRATFFSKRVVNIWNNLSSSIVDSNSLEIFKNSISQLNLSQYCRGRDI